MLGSMPVSAKSKTGNVSICKSVYIYTVLTQKRFTVDSNAVKKIVYPNCVLNFTSECCDCQDTILCIIFSNLLKVLHTTLDL